MRISRTSPGVRPAAGALAVAALCAAGVQPAEARPAGSGDGRPNILVVMADDMTTSDLAAMPATRRLLSKQGTSFKNTIVSFPLCCPSRATFITGQYAHNNGVIGNFYPTGWYGMPSRENILSAWLDKAGYDTAFIGKWLNGYGAADGRGEIPAGFDTWRGLLDVSAYDYFNFAMNVDGDVRYWGDADFARKLVEFGKIQVVPPDQKSFIDVHDKLTEVMGPAPYSYWGTEDPADYSSDVTGRITRKLVAGERRSKKPFFIWWAPAAPHAEDASTTLMGRPGPDPRAPHRHRAWAEGLALPQSPSFNEADISDKPSNVTAYAGPLSAEAIEQLRLDYQGRMGSLRAVDDHVRKLVRTLRRTGQLRNTLIMFTSDNGWLHGEHRIPGDKFLPYEESLHVPLILRGPGVARGKRIGGQVSNVDLAPTLVDAADARARRKMDGISLLPAAKRPKRLPDRVLAVEALRPLFTGNIPVNRWDRPYKGVRTARHTYIVWTETGDLELYDRRSDPFQLQNLAYDPGHAGVVAELAAKLARLEACKGRACNVRP
jgi:N-acetylglucosamine-6-sulfatase